MIKKIRSDLFHSAGRLSDKFDEHVVLVWNYTPSQRQVILNHMLKMLSAVTERDQMTARERYVKDIGGDPQTAIKAMQVLQTIAYMWNPGRDTVEGALEDIQVLNVLPEKVAARKSALAFLRKFFSILEKDSARRLRVRAAGAILPTLRSATTAIDCRSVFGISFDWLSDDPKKYRPDFHGFKVVALIRIKLDEGDPIVFQCDREDLEMLIRKFQATLKDISVSKKACG